MVSKDQFRSAARKAVDNIIQHGDTDIFPFPFENLAFSDNINGIVDLICEYNDNFIGYITKYPPRNINSLSPVAYSGFRWATQIDPIWNAHFLASVLAISGKIESVRPDKLSNIVFSYRYNQDKNTSDIFDRDYGWVQFMEFSQKMCENCEYVVMCDVSEFYPRLNHHRIENCLKQVAGDTKYPSQIIQFLSVHTNTMSFGLPVGGPAARILSEATINQIDKLLIGAGIKFARFADDYHIFTDSKESAYHSLIFLSEKLLENQGLSLQKSKTRIMSSSEFRSTNPILHDMESRVPVGGRTKSSSLVSQFTRFSLRFDPYSTNAQEDYDALKRQVDSFNVIDMLKSELTKTKIHSSLTKK